MDEREIRNLIGDVKAGRLSRRRFIQTMVGLGLGAPLASQMLASAGIAAAQTRGSYPGAKRGGGGQLKVLWWQAATLLNVNCPAGEPQGIEVTRLGKRLYNDELRLVDEDGDGRCCYQIYGFEPFFEDEPGTDLAAVARRRISLTPVHFDLTDREGLGRLRDWDLEAMLRAAMTGAA